MMRGAFKNSVVLLLAVLLAGLGVYNLVQKATWSLMDDGVFWKAGPEGVVAARLAEGGPGAVAGVAPGDVLLAVDDHEVLAPTDLDAQLAARRTTEPLRYTILRSSERRSLDVLVRPLPRGNITLFFYLSLVGFFSLVVGTIVMVRRPSVDRASPTSTRSASCSS